jgi:hypothetical protein
METMRKNLMREESKSGQPVLVGLGQFVSWAKRQLDVLLEAPDRWPVMHELHRQRPLPHGIDGKASLPDRLRHSLPLGTLSNDRPPQSR